MKPHAKGVAGLLHCLPSVVLAAYVVNGALAPGIAPCGSGGTGGGLP